MIPEKASAIVHDEGNIKGFYDGYRWLDNFYPCKVVFENDEYVSSENAFQAAKEVWADRSKFFKCTPSEAKYWGGQVKLDIDKWNARRLDVMYRVVLAKFSQNPDLKQKLLDTGSKYLEETNFHDDCYWGVCNGFGENHLGKILMRVRNALRG